ncbi:class I SAM-dependent methyltransferase [Christiangramia salexigens]|uniref:Methyltransferase n=1 Tax=Christiangramia salexigens TaxID=1913577 RepID=A0A1L3J1S4_9FLAO|nr:class I SAM-dependent methyltransferase [Christiangramia salexigens]APG59071.1 methyltransferase [Christiangramia salexigens]
MLCSLCNGATKHFHHNGERGFVHCLNCKAILLSKEFYLSHQAEKFRYQLHNNDINDEGYINFVNPIIERIKKDHSMDANGLDFGCGTGPVIASELGKYGYHIELYDPFFRPNVKLLDKDYEIIICCEVMEHFHEPFREFQLLNELLRPGGKLYCKTQLWRPNLDFGSWHYKNDKTHVFFYSKESLQWIQKMLNFTSIEICRDYMVFTR